MFTAFHEASWAMTPARSRRSISASSKPAARNTSTVCWPMAGARVGGTFSWPSIAIGLLTVSAAPARGSSMGTSAPLFTICSSVRMSSSVATTPKTMPLVSRIRRHSAQSFVAKTSSRIATSARTLVRRVATVAIMAALYRRERTGRGGMVSTSLMANGLWWNAIQVQGILCGARTPTRPAREDAASALANLYRCRDGRWFLMTITGAELHWDAFARCIARADLITDPRFATVATRRTNVRALVAILDEVFATKDWAEWRRILETSGIVFGVVATLDDILTD